MRKQLFLLAFGVFIINTAIGQSDCKVKLKELSESYTGACKKGYAEGHGSAKGERDSYTGYFKKGIPHGIGTYIWGNGNIYIGNFVKGKMDGKGTLTLKEAENKVTVQKGFFDNNEYIGEYQTPYKVISKREVKNVYFQEVPKQVLGEDNYEIVVKVKDNAQNGEISGISNLTINDLNGSNIVGNKIINVKFPLKKIEISFTTSLGHSARVVLEVYKKANWLIEISI